MRTDFSSLSLFSTCPPHPTPPPPCFPGCYKITTVFSHAQSVVLCGGCSIVLCQPSGGKCRLTEGEYHTLVQTVNCVITAPAGLLFLFVIDTSTPSLLSLKCYMNAKCCRACSLNAKSMCSRFFLHFLLRLFLQEEAPLSRW